LKRSKASKLWLTEETLQFESASETLTRITKSHEIELSERLDRVSEPPSLGGDSVSRKKPSRVPPCRPFFAPCATCSRSPSDLATRVRHASRPKHAHNQALVATRAHPMHAPNPSSEPSTGLRRTVCTPLRSKHAPNPPSLGQHQNSLVFDLAIHSSRIVGHDSEHPSPLGVCRGLSHCLVPLLVCLVVSHLSVSVPPTRTSLC
jgi:hypothetical protein